MPPPLTDEEERDDERRRLLESVDYRALDGFEDALNPITRPGSAPRPFAPSPREDERQEVIRPFADSEPLVISPRREPASEPESDEPESHEPYRGEGPQARSPMTEGARRIAGGVAYPPGSPLPLPPRAQRIEDQTRARASQPQSLQPLAAQPELESAPTPVDELEAPPEVDERALASLAGEEPELPTRPLTRLHPRTSQVAALGEPSNEFEGPDELEAARASKPEPVIKAGASPGIPGEDELARARTEDVPRRLLHNLANAFRVMGGRSSPRAFVSNEDRVRAQQREMLGDKRVARREEQQASSDAMTRALQERQAAQRETRDQLESDLARRNADRQDLLSGAQRERLSEEVLSTRATRERSAAERSQRSDANSPISRSMQDAMRTRIATYRTTGQTRLADELEQLFTQERLPTMSADELEPVLGRTGGLPQSQLRGRASGGSGAPRDGLGGAERRQALLAAGQGAGLDPAVMATMSDRDLANRIEQRTRRSGSGSEPDQADTLIVGFRRRADGTAPNLTRTELIRARGVAAEYSQLRSTLTELERLSNEVSAMEQAGGRAGVVSDRLAYAASLHENVINALRSIGNLGVPTGNELQRMENLAPSLTSVQGFVRAAPSYRGVRDAQRLSVRTLLHDLGYDPDSSGSAGGGQSRPQRRSGGSTVRVVLPDGRRGTIPESQLEAALSAGARRAE